jgi:hypothetical protein
VTADSVTPNSGTGATQAFALQYSDTLGATDLATMWVWFNATLAGSSANSCMLFYTRATNTLSLLGNGSVWMPGTIGSATTLQNSQCGVNLGASSVAMNGNTLTVTLAMTFTSAYAGAKNVYMYAANGGGLTSGWQDRGDWTVPQGVVPGVTADSVTPDSGTGATQTFALQYSDTLGATGLSTVWVWFNATFASSSANSCLLYYNRATATLSLLNDAQTWMPGTLGGAGGTLQNSQCGVNLGASSVTMSGDTLTLTLAMTFTASYAGAKNIYMFAANASGLTSGWQDRGDWTVPQGVVPGVTADSVTPNNGSGSSQTFALQYTDSLGALDMRTAWVWFNTTFALWAANSCLVYYDRAFNTLFLLDDAGSVWMAATLGASTTLQNSRCAISVGNSTATLVGNTLTVNLAMTFTGPYQATTQNIYMYGAGSSMSSGWQLRGTFAVP